jgi:GT2 family glycosyltransferase
VDALRRLDIGIASYKAPEKLKRCIESVQRHSVTDWRLFVCHNPSEGDDATREVICGAADRDARVVPVWMAENVGYAGAVNELFRRSETEYTAYLDNDTKVTTGGWDETLCGYLDRFHEIGLVFPNMGHYAIKRDAYTECLWAAGFAWVVSRMAQRAVGEMDTTLGHHEEVDFCTRLRLEGYRLACAPEVAVGHDETATRNPASMDRINAGIVRWMNKWAAYFCGKGVTYHSPNVLRVTDWPPHALYLEEWYRAKLPGLNENPHTVTIDGAEMDLIKIPKPKGFYRGRYA